MLEDDDVFMQPRPTKQRPLLGVTILVVEDSGFASEAIHILCRKSGARFRRADSLATAERHLRVFRPHAVVIDLGLPDGNGLDLIRRLAQIGSGGPAILAVSGDDALEPLTYRAGAQGFMAKPIVNLAAFQNAVLQILPNRKAPSGPRILPTDIVSPEQTSYYNDLSKALAMVKEHPTGAKRAYVAQFLSGLALYSCDDELQSAVENLQDKQTDPHTADAALATLVSKRLQAILSEQLSA